MDLLDSAKMKSVDENSENGIMDKNPKLLSKVPVMPFHVDLKDEIEESTASATNSIENQNEMEMEQSDTQEINSPKTVPSCPGMEFQRDDALDSSTSEEEESVGRSGENSAVFPNKAELRSSESMDPSLSSEESVLQEESNPTDVSTGSQVSSNIESIVESNFESNSELNAESNVESNVDSESNSESNSESISESISESNSESNSESIQSSDLADGAQSTSFLPTNRRRNRRRRNSNQRTVNKNNNKNNNEKNENNDLNEPTKAGRDEFFVTDTERLYNSRYKQAIRNAMRQQHASKSTQNKNSTLHFRLPAPPKNYSFVEGYSKQPMKLLVLVSSMEPDTVASMEFDHV